MEGESVLLKTDQRGQRVAAGAGPAQDPGQEAVVRHLDLGNNYNIRSKFTCVEISFLANLTLLFPTFCVFA